MNNRFERTQPRHLLRHEFEDDTPPFAELVVWGVLAGLFIGLCFGFVGIAP